ncbi:MULTISPECIES: hypothetical protein [Micromonospora]|uniref:Uncharacterized protein n=1 Tax=Micromonospora yangpuensis TaxID=683228 RepID=A0A1C6UGY3_9ACTN|nr:hypothetical protein [Micromonospora yangpuensis]GGM04353.1 hypothetical protein GCM10012279_22650 [Micromonospora yangpuensis]SCL53297.1 hypothetical protein GA0070617_2328 [Micromonospora yangpuensis]
MSALMQRISRFLSSPKGQQMVDRGRRELAKPGNQDKLRQLASRLSGRRR